MVPLPLTSHLPWQWDLHVLSCNKGERQFVHPTEMSAKYPPGAGDGNTLQGGLGHKASCARGSPDFLACSDF